MYELTLALEAALESQYLRYEYGAWMISWLTGPHVKRPLRTHRIFKRPARHQKRKTIHASDYVTREDFQRAVAESRKERDRCPKT